MYCENCGAKIPDNSEFCSSCGDKQPSRPQSTTAQGQAENQQQNGESTQYGMKWFKFLIYFSLFVSAVFAFIGGVQYITGSVYGSDAATVYSFYPGLKAIDILYGLASMALGVFAIYTRFQLSSYKKNGPTCLYASYAASAVVAFIYAAAASAAIGESCFESISTSIAGPVAMILVNRTYFNKRKSLFVN